MRPSGPAKFAGIEDLPKRVQVMPADVELGQGLH
jgi:threonine synthase